MRPWHIIVSSAVTASALALAVLLHQAVAASGHNLPAALWSGLLSDRTTAAIVWLTGYGICASLLVTLGLVIEFWEALQNIQLLVGRGYVINKKLADLLPMLRNKSRDPFYRLFIWYSPRRSARPVLFIGPAQIRGTCTRLYFVRIATTQCTTALLILFLLAVMPLGLHADSAQLAVLPLPTIASPAFMAVAAIATMALLGRLALSPVIAALVKAAPDPAIELLRQILELLQPAVTREKMQPNVETGRLEDAILTLVASMEQLDRRAKTTLEEVKEKIVDHERSIVTSAESSLGEFAAEFRAAVAGLDAGVARLTGLVSALSNVNVTPAVAVHTVVPDRMASRLSNELREILDEIDPKPIVG